MCRMISKIIHFISRILFVSLPEREKQEFDTEILRINVARGKATAITFIVVEVIILAVSFLNKKSSMLKQPEVYYSSMYFLLMLAMSVYVYIFMKVEKNIAKNRTKIWITGISFALLILLCSAGISLLDQYSSGQINVYTYAIIAVATLPLYQPITLLLIYVTVQLLFISFMPYFQISGELLFGNDVNSSVFLIISWVIASMRYKSAVEDFNNKKTIQKSSQELKKVNKELEEVNQKLAKLSRTDSLTGIFNRSVFDETLQVEWDRCKRHILPLSLIMIDIDFFKAFNDHYGHQAGDDCLKKVAGVLSSTTKRSTGIVSRYGGEEFTVILPNMTKEKALDYAERLRITVEELSIPHAYSAISKSLTVSLGVHTLIPSDQLSMKELIVKADKALYEAKKERNKVCG